MDEQNPRLVADRMTGRSDEQLTGYDTSGADARTPEAYPATAAPVSRVATRGTTTAGEPRTTELRAEIEQTREDMSETVNAIQERLRPGNLAANAAETVKHAARERARDVADSESVQYVRANPIPTAMIGIGIAGLAWLAFGGNEPRYATRRLRSRDWERRLDADRQRLQGESGYSGYESASGYTAGTAYTEGDTPYYQSGTRSGGGSRGTGANWRGDEGMTSRARESAYRAQYAAQRTWNENPLLVGAASAVLGTIVGLAIPETERENELMGETRDGLVESVQETVKERVQQVQEAASNVASTVQDAARTVTGMTTETPATSQSQPHQPGSLDTGRS